MLRVADASQAWIAFLQLQPVDEAAEFDAADLVAGGEQRRAGPEQIEVRVDSSLDLLASGFSVAQEFGLGARLARGGDVPTGDDGERAGQGPERVRHPPAKGEAPPGFGREVVRLGDPHFAGCVLTLNQRHS